MALDPGEWWHLEVLNAHRKKPLKEWGSLGNEGRKRRRGGKDKEYYAKWSKPFSKKTWLAAWKKKGKRPHGRSAASERPLGRIELFYKTCICSRENIGKKHKKPHILDISKFYLFPGYF